MPVACPQPEVPVDYKEEIQDLNGNLEIAQIHMEENNFLDAQILKKEIRASMRRASKLLENLEIR